MPLFKPKNSKKLVINEKNNITLDGKHKEYLNEFYKDENILIPQYLNEKNELENELNQANLSIEKQLELKENINNIKKNIIKLKNKKKNYLLNNSSYIFEYFENKKNISEGISNEKIKSLDEFFNIDSNIQNDKNTTSAEKYFNNINNNFDINNFCLTTDICNYCKLGEMIPVEYEGIISL